MQFNKATSAIVIASLFATPAFAASFPHHSQNTFDSVNGSPILKNFGYIDANLSLLLDPKSNGGLNVQLQHSDVTSDNTGVINLTAENLNLNQGGYLNICSVSFNDNKNVTTNISLKESTLSFNEHIKLQNTDISGTLPEGTNIKDLNNYLSKDVKPAVYNITLDNTTLTSNIINKIEIPGNQLVSSGNITTISLTNNSVWNGDLTKQFAKTPSDRWTPLDSNNITNQNTVQLSHSTWNGNVHDDGKETTTVHMTKESQWHITGDSKAHNVTTDAGSNVVLESNSSLRGVTSAQGNFSLNANSTLDVMHSVDMRARLMSLDNVDVTLQQTNNVNLIVDGSLNDGSVSADKLLDQANQSFTTGSDQKATIEVESGLITDGLSANVVGDKITSTHSNKNANLVTTSELVAIQMMQWRAEADDMNQRMGELRDSTDANGLWVRTYGGKAEASKVDNEFVGFQFGYDHNVSSGANQQFIGGAISYTKGDANYSTGTGDNDTFAFTGYSTWLLDNGSYVDFSAKYGKLNSDFDIKTALGNLNGDYSTHGLAMGIEVGHRFPVANLFYFEPQVAFTASHIFGEDFGAGQGVTIEQDSINSYVARAGLAAGIKCPDNMGSVWMKASYLYDFDGETTTLAKQNASVNQYDQDFGGGWYELGLGASVNFTKNLHGYADFEYASGAEIETPYKWNVGVRYTY